MKNLLKGFVIGLALLGFANAVSAQVVSPLVPSMHQNDTVQVNPYGAPSAQSQFAPPGAIAGVDQYSYQVPLTAFSITVPVYVAELYLNPAGTLATGTLTLMAAPSDGQRFCLEDSQTQTAITISANTGQTLTSGTYCLATPTALVANTRYCWRYFGSQAAWVRTL